jgi:hypothetical protein
MDLQGILSVKGGNHKETSIIPLCELCRVIRSIKERRTVVASSWREERMVSLFNKYQVSVWGNEDFWR